MTDTVVAEPATLNDTFTLTVDGAPRELFMSYGMLNELTRLVASAEQVPLLTIDPDLRAGVLTLLLAPRDEKGKMTGDVNLMKVRLPVTQVNELMEWVAEHTLGFLLNALEGTQRLTQKFEGRVQKLTSSSTGTKA